MFSGERANLLVITLSNIGDVILTTPVIRSLRSRFPRARLTVVVGPKAAPLLRGSSQIDRLLVYDKQAGWPHKLQLVRALREEFYDTVVDLRNSAFPFTVRASHRSPIFRPHRAPSARARHLELLEMMKLPPVRKLEPFDFFSKEEEAVALKKFGDSHQIPFMIVAPGAGSEAKRWRIEGFCETTASLLKHFSLNAVVVGDRNEIPLGEKLFQIDPERVVNLTGQISLRELAALVSHAKLVLTNDSAVMHLGHELDRPVAALFGPTNPERYGRQNEIWRIVRDPERSTLEAIQPHEVFEVCRELLG